MVVPQPFPDEILHGLLGRIARLNGLQSHNQLIKALSPDKDPPKTCGSSWLVSTVAGHCKMSIAAFAHLHTLGNFFGIIRRNRAADVAVIGSVAKLGMELGRGFPGLCRRCVDEDLNFWGTTYWRRTHQVPGMVTCLKHGSLLCWSFHHEGFFNSPAEALEEEAQLYESSAEWASSPIVQRYQVLSSAMLEMTPRHFLTQLRRAGIDVKVPFTTYDWHPREDARQSIRTPAGWLQLLLPAAKQYLPISVSRPLLSQDAPLCLLYLATTFTSTDEVLRIISSVRLEDASGGDLVEGPGQSAGVALAGFSG